MNFLWVGGGADVYVCVCVCVGGGGGDGGEGGDFMTALTSTLSIFSVLHTFPLLLKSIALKFYSFYQIC